MVKGILALLVIGGLGFFAYTMNQEPAEIEADLPDPTGNTKPPEYEKQDVAGVEPDGEPDFNVDAELTFDGLRPVLTFSITEKHGWYADYVYIDFWYVQEDENGELQQLGDPVRYMCHHYLDFGATLVENTTPMHIEFPEIPEDLGKSENWKASVGDYGRVLAPEAN